VVSVVSRRPLCPWGNAALLTAHPVCRVQPRAHFGNGALGVLRRRPDRPGCDPRTADHGQSSETDGATVMTRQPALAKRFTVAWRCRDGAGEDQRARSSLAAFGFALMAKSSRTCGNVWRKDATIFAIRLRLPPSRCALRRTSRLRRTSKGDVRSRYDLQAQRGFHNPRVLVDDDLCMGNAA